MIEGVSLVFGFVFLVFLLIALFVFLFVFWIIMIVDVAKRDFKKENDKIVWILIVVLLGWFGGLIYYFVVKRKDKR